MRRHGFVLGYGCFLAIGVYKFKVGQAALYSLVMFMLGLAAGRTLSLMVDGMPYWLLVAYLVVELVLGGVGLQLLKKPNPS